MRGNTNSSMRRNRPQSILVIGCGLIGTSFALAVKARDSEVVIDGVEINPLHFRSAQKHGVFSHLFENVADVSLPQNTPYDLAVLAVPVDAACLLLEETLLKAQVVMDVCSVKEGICRTAEELGAREQFAPTHPMAGLATAGPEQATAELFRNRPWLFIEGWSASQQVISLVREIGARIEILENPSQHDEAMAVVSHAIHLVSLSAMLAYGEAEEGSSIALSHLTGPAFRDITRLSGSPSGFWVSTLLANRRSVTEHLNQIVGQLQKFEVALKNGNAQQLVELLDSARELHEKWKGELS